MEIQIRQQGEVTILAPLGRLTLNEGASDLRARAKELVGAGKKKLVINLQGVDYIDSTGLDCLISSYVTAKKAQGDIRLTGLPSRVRQLMRITHLDTIFPIFPGESEAIGSY